MEAKPFLQSRKTRIIIIDAVATIITVWLSLFFADKPLILEAMLTTVVALQTMAALLIGGIVSEDNSRRDSETRRIEADAWNGQPAGTDPQ